MTDPDAAEILQPILDDRSLRYLQSTRRKGNPLLNKVGDLLPPRLKIPSDSEPLRRYRNKRRGVIASESELDPPHVGMLTAFRNIQERLKEYISYPYTEALTRPETIAGFLQLLGTPMQPHEINTFTDQEYNFIVHMGKMFLETAEHTQPHAAQVIKPHLTDVRRLLFILNKHSEYHFKHHEKHLWHYNLMYPINSEDFLSPQSISEDPHVNKALLDLENLFGTNLEDVSPADRYTIPPGSGYHNRWSTRGSDRGLPSPAQYRQQHDSAFTLAELNLKGGLKRRIDTLQHLINQSFPYPEAVLHFPDGPQEFKASPKINSPIVALPNEIPITELSSFLHAELLNQIKGMEWEDARQLGFQVIDVLKKAVVEFREGDNLPDLPGYKPISQHKISSPDQELLTAACQQFVIDRLEQQKTYKEIMSIPSYYKVQLFFYLAFTLFWSSYLLNPDSLYHNRPSLQEVFSSIGEFLGELLSSDESTGYAEIFNPLIKLTSYVGSASDIFPESHYSGPENNSIPLGELRKREQMTVIHNLDDKSGFMPLLSATYSFNPNSPFSVSWETHEVIGPDPKHISFEDSIPSNSWKQMRHYVYSEGRHLAETDFEELRQLSALDSFNIVNEVIGTTVHSFIVDRKEIDLSTSTERYLFIQVPVDANSAFIASDGEIDISTGSTIAHGDDGSRYLVIDSAKLDGKHSIIFLRTLSSANVQGQAISIEDRNVYSIEDIPNQIPITPIPFKEGNLTEHESIASANAELSEFISRWGIDFDQILTDLTAEPLSLDSQHDSAHHYLSSKQYLELEIKHRLSELVNEQLNDLGVHYSTDESINRFLNKDEIRTYFIAANTVGLDCDSLAFITNVIVNSFISQHEFIDVRVNEIGYGGQYYRVHFDQKAIANRTLIMGEMDTNRDGWFSGNINHARVSIGHPFHQFSFEATAGLPVSETTSPEQLANFFAGLETELGYDPRPYESDKSHNLWGVGIIAAASAAAAAARGRRLNKAKAQDRKRAALLSNLYEREERKERPHWIRLSKDIQNLTTEQLSLLPEVFAYLLTDTYKPLDPLERKKSHRIYRKYKLLRTLKVRGVNAPALESLEHLSYVLKYFWDTADIKTLTSGAIALRLTINDSSIGLKEREVFHVAARIFNLVSPIVKVSSVTQSVSHGLSQFTQALQLTNQPNDQIASDE